ncbi:MAG: hypothetical protein JOZ49_24675 [Mycolicibacterium sp.]|nr:hypothetical protein [Mycolicibacterium sp.]
MEGSEGSARLARPKLIALSYPPVFRHGATEHPRDVANVCRFLASPLTSYVSGVVVAADGRWAPGGAASAMAAIGQPLLDAMDDKF